MLLGDAEICALCIVWYDAGIAKSANKPERLGGGSRGPAVLAEAELAGVDFSVTGIVPHVGHMSHLEQNSAQKSESAMLCESNNLLERGCKRTNGGAGSACGRVQASEAGARASATSAAVA